MLFKPLSIPERHALAEQLRREAAEKIAEAERIEAGLEADANEMVTAIERALAKRDAPENALICPRCKVDRLKQTCPDNSMNCPIRGEAYTVPNKY